MNIVKNKFKGLFELLPNVNNDSRGIFSEIFTKRNFNKNVANVNFVQKNLSKSKRGVIRGLHFQVPPFEQSKLIHCVSGEILDIALDIRKNSKTYGLYNSTILNEKKNNSLFIPKGFAHGFIVLSNSATVIYEVDNYYSPKSESGIKFNDPNLNIDWKLDKSDFIISEKDSKLRMFSELNSPF